MNIEELINSSDIETATLYCNIYIQTHSKEELKKVLKRYIIMSYQENIIVLDEIWFNDSSGIFLKDPSRMILLKE